MKTRILVAGVVVAAISAFSLTAKAQGQPAIKVVPGMEKNTVKLIYGYDQNETVEVSFLDKTGTISTERIKAKNFNRGFIKKYKIQRDQYDALWIEVKSNEVAVTYKLIAPTDGKWMAQLEKATYNYPTVALR
jgi:hypothetical protein